MLVVGAGVSRAAAGLPGWTQAVELAIDHLESTGMASVDRIGELRQQLAEADSVEALTRCASHVRGDLSVGASGSGEFGSWLKKTFDVPLADVDDHALVSSILRLPAAMITTTNYDKILSGSRLGAEGVTWRESNLVLQALENGKNVVHLHGAWDDPESVVLGEADYDRLYQDEAYRAFMRTLWLSKTLVFVGCSLDGIQDPDFVRFLDWTASTFPDSTVKHYALVRTNSYTPEDAQRFLNRWRIQLVPYGDSYNDLLPFISRFVPPRVDHPPPSPPSVFVGRQEVLDGLKSAIRRGDKTLVHGMGGIGKTSLVSTAAAELVAEIEPYSTLWVDGDGKLALELAKEIGRAAGLEEIDLLESPEAASQLKRWLSTEDRLHVVIDIFDDPEESRHFVRDFVPTTFPVTVIARRRSTGFQTYIPVGSLDPTASEELFCAVAGIEQGQQVVQEICEAVDGHPLALTLAGSRVVVEDLPLGRLKNRLQDARDRLPTLRNVDLEDSPSTSVRASLYVSFENLPDELLSAIAALAHFPSTVTCDLLAPTLDVDLLRCEDVIGRLVSRSLIERDSFGILRLHPLVRDFVLDFDRTEGLDYQSSIESAFVDLAKRIYTDDASVERIIGNNVDSVLGFIRSTTREDSTDRQIAAVLFVDALFRPYGIVDSYLITSIGLSNRRALIDHGLRLIGDIPVTELKAAMQVCMAHTHTEERDYGAAIRVLEQADEALIEDGGDFAQRSFVKCEIGNRLIELHRYDEAENVMTEGLVFALQSGDKGSIAQLTGQLGQVRLRIGNLDVARTNYEEARALYQQLGNSTGVASCMYWLAEISRALGDFERAWGLDCESLEADIVADNVGGALTSLERLAVDIRNREQASFVLAKLDSIEPTLPAHVDTGTVDAIRGQALALVGETDRAKQLLERVHAARAHAGDLRGAAVALGRLSNIADVEHRWEDAWQYNELSRQSYETANELRGVHTCGLNGMRIGEALEDTPKIVKASCVAISAAASMNDLGGIAEAILRVPEDVRRAVTITAPEQRGASREETLALIAQAADAEALGTAVGLATYLIGKEARGG